MNRHDVLLHTEPCSGGNYRGSGARTWAESASMQYSSDAVVNVRKKMRVHIRRILRKHGFPPDLQADAIKKVVQQAEVLAREFA
jgi:hypothetical protein